jgi:hypothetical protein
MWAILREMKYELPAAAHARFGSARSQSNVSRKVSSTGRACQANSRLAFSALAQKV